MRQALSLFLFSRCAAILVDALSTPSPSNLPPELLRALRSNPPYNDAGSASSTPSSSLDRKCTLHSLLPPSDRSRSADSPDEYFYGAPMIVQHNDDAFRFRLSSLYASLLPPDGGGTFLDLGSSWVSHLPDDPQPARVWLHGMNAEELERNPAGNGWRIARSFNDLLDPVNSDLLNSEGRREAIQMGTCLLPEIPSESVDVVGVCAAFQYWRFPERVAAEALRVLKPGGRVVVSFSNRMFASKAVGGWTRRSDGERIKYVSNVLERGVEPMEGNKEGCLYTLKVKRRISDSLAASVLTMPLSMLMGRNVAGDPFLAVVAQKIKHE